MLPRAGRLLLDRNLGLSLLAALLLTAFGRDLPLGTLQIGDLASAGLAYSALAFGACVTGAVLTVSLAPYRRVRELATSGPEDWRYPHYSELLFVFTWSAVAQLAVILASLLAYIMGGSTVVGPADPYPSHLVLLFLAASVLVYALLQLFTVVATLSQLGVVLISQANADDADNMRQETH